MLLMPLMCPTVAQCTGFVILQIILGGVLSKNNKKKTNQTYEPRMLSMCTPSVTLQPSDRS